MNSIEVIKDAMNRYEDRGSVDVYLKIITETYKDYIEARGCHSLIGSDDTENDMEEALYDVLIVEYIVKTDIIRRFKQDAFNAYYAKYCFKCVNNLLKLFNGFDYIYSNNYSTEFRMCLENKYKWSERLEKLWNKAFGVSGYIFCKHDNKAEISFRHYAN